MNEEEIKKTDLWTLFTQCKDFYLKKVIMTQ